MTLYHEKVWEESRILREENPKQRDDFLWILTNWIVKCLIYYPFFMGKKLVLKNNLWNNFKN